MTDCTDPCFIHLLSAVADDVPSLLHWGMFIPSLKTLLSDAQKAEWMGKCYDCTVVGCYAQTELGHGSNVRGLETEARFDASGPSWVLNTPTLTSTKFWPGSLGKTANTAMVIARLIDGSGVDRGVHNFIVPIRDYATHEPLPGVTVGDIGSKLGYNNMDNGYLKLRNVRVPLSNMAMRFVSVDGRGRYKKNTANASEASEKISYLTMMQVRAQIVGMASQALAMATTIAVRYSAVRLQGFDSSGKRERQILDYVQQQHRLFGHLASSYCFFFSGKSILKRLKDTERKIVSGGGASSGAAGTTKIFMGDLHASISALKAYSSSVAADGIEDCRKACGGHGYLVASGFPELLTTYLQNPTVEGDNYMLPQQVCKILLKLLKSVREDEDQGKGFAERSWSGTDCFYLVAVTRRLLGGSFGEKKRRKVRSLHVLQSLFELRAGKLLVDLGEKIFGHISEGMSMEDAWNDSLIQIARVSRAHVMVVLLKNFTDGLREFGSRERGVMRDLALLFGFMELERNTSDFIGFASQAEIDKSRNFVIELLKRIRPNAVLLGKLRKSAAATYAIHNKKYILSDH